MHLTGNDFLIPVGFDPGADGGAPEGDAAAADGATTSSDSSDGGTQGTADSSAALAKAEEQRRSFQSRAEKAEADSRALTQRLDALEKRLSGNGGSDDDGGASKPVDTDALANELHARFKREAALERAAEALKGDLSYADPAIFERASEFDSPDALREAAEASHARVNSLIEAAVAEQREAILERVAKEYGVRLAPSTNDGATNTGEMTLERFRSLSFSDQGKFERENPDKVAELLRSAV